MTHATNCCVDVTMIDKKTKQFKTKNYDRQLGSMNAQINKAMKELYAITNNDQMHVEVNINTPVMLKFHPEDPQLQLKLLVK